MKFFLQITFEAPSSAIAEAFGKAVLNEDIVSDLLNAAKRVDNGSVAAAKITLGRFRVLSEEKEEKKDGKDKEAGPTDSKDEGVGLQK